MVASFLVAFLPFPPVHLDTSLYLWDSIPTPPWLYPSGYLGSFLVCLGTSLYLWDLVPTSGLRPPDPSLTFHLCLSSRIPLPSLYPMATLGNPNGTLNPEKLAANPTFAISPEAQCNTETVNKLIQFSRSIKEFNRKVSMTQSTLNNAEAYIFSNPPTVNQGTPPDAIWSSLSMPFRPADAFIHPASGQSLDEPENNRRASIYVQGETGWLDRKDIKNAAKEMNMTQLCTTLLFALAYHPAAILSCVRVVDKPPVNYLQMWLTWDNMHTQNQGHPLNCISRTFILLSRQAALGLIETLDIPCLFFKTPYVKEFLDTADSVEHYA
ncbi:hypothetical protein DFH08DRAFT_824766 [Mycena albidolilacea]|uniref:Uncharacterized protein n=1 Tax=Mycena albidolilacea TaxID=1033008 RepID=A0AAD6Z464_9AGAR|nr:hypothetical protein DFH08DRAFT_824766 [Mycena albidolilacea]